jgi:hypothetical protein
MLERRCPVHLLRYPRLGATGVPGLGCSWNRDETRLHVSYVGADRKVTSFSAELEDDVFRNQNGNVVARVLPGGNIVPTRMPFFPRLRMMPKLCPMPGLDRAGDRGRDYEDYAKSIVNPVDTTLRYSCVRTSSCRRHES